MPKSVSISQINDERYTHFEDGTVRKDKLIPARIVKVNRDLGQKTASNGKKYWNVTVEADLPSGWQRGPALLWDDLLISNDNSFDIGSNITLAVICTGEYAANAVIEIPNFHIEYKDLFDCGFTDIEGFEDLSDEENDEREYSDAIEDASLLNNSSSLILSNPEGEWRDNTTYSESPLTEELKPVSQNNDAGCGKTIFAFAISFILIGIVISPFSFLGFLLYPIWVGGAFLLAKFILEILPSAGDKK